MRMLSTSTIANDVAIRTRTLTNEVDKHMNNANESAKHKNNGRRR